MERFPAHWCARDGESRSTRHLDAIRSIPISLLLPESVADRAALPGSTNGWGPNIPLEPGKDVSSDRGCRPTSVDGRLPSRQDIQKGDRFSTSLAQRLPDPFMADSSNPRSGHRHLVLYACWAVVVIGCGADVHVGVILRTIAFLHQPALALVGWPFAASAGVARVLSWPR